MEELDRQIAEAWKASCEQLGIVSDPSEVQKVEKDFKAKCDAQTAWVRDQTRLHLEHKQKQTQLVYTQEEHAKWLNDQDKTTHNVKHEPDSGNGQTDSWRNWKAGSGGYKSDDSWRNDRQDDANTRETKGKGKGKAEKERVQRAQGYEDTDNVTHSGDRRQIWSTFVATSRSTLVTQYEEELSGQGGMHRPPSKMHSFQEAADVKQFVLGNPNTLNQMNEFKARELASKALQQVEAMARNASRAAQFSLQDGRECTGQLC